MKKLTYIPILLLTLLGSFVQGQDAHFSQFYLAQQELNPAMNGLFQGQYRAGVQYRDQSSNIVGVESYRTSYASFDSKIHIKNNDYITYGLDFMRDAAGAGKLSQTQGHISIGYIKQLTDNKYGAGEQFLIASFRGGFGQNAIDWSKVWFGRQFDVDAGSVDLGSSSGEVFVGSDGSTSLYGDLGGGLLWYALWNDRKSIYLGASAYHLNQPSIGFSGSSNESLYRRITIHGGGEVPLNRELSLLPNVVFHVQGPSRMLIPGAQFRYSHRDWKEVALRFGTFTRVTRDIDGISNDAIIFSATFEYQSLLLGLAYDVSTSSIVVANSGRGAFEFSLQYRNPNARYRTPLKCPQF